jgi:hypothetical protein
VVVRLSLIAALLVVAACSSKTKPGAETKSKTADAAPAAAPPPKSFTIRVVNKRAAAILVVSPTECAQWPVAITGAEERGIQVDGQALDCDSARAGNCPTFGSCAGPQPYRLEAGATITHEWNRLEMNWHNLRAAEVGEDCPTSCVSRDAVPAGTYTFSAAAWSACENPAGCMPQAPDLTASATATLPDANEVVVEFQ